MLIELYDMVLDFRRALGEAPESIAKTQPPTTRVLAAYQTFAVANRTESNDERLVLFKRAVEIDPEFIAAYLALGNTLSILGDFKAARMAEAEAYQRRAALPARSRLRLELQHLQTTNDYDAAFDQAKTFARLYPTDWWGQNQLCLLQGLAYEDPTFAESSCREAYRLFPTSRLQQTNLSETFLFHGKVEEILDMIGDLRQRGTPESWIDLHLLWVSMLRNDEESLRQIVDRMRQASIRHRAYATRSLLRWLLATGRFAEARKEVSAAWRGADQYRSPLFKYFIELGQIWLSLPEGGGPPLLSGDSFKLVQGHLPQLPMFAAYAVDTRLDEPLADLIEEHEMAETGSESRYVLEELQFARGCLALIRGDNRSAREHLEPLARNSTRPRRHRMLGRAYESLGLLRQAAHEYEVALRHPRIWDDYQEYAIPAMQVLEQFRLAKVYEQLGDTDLARHWYEQFTDNWKDADPDIPELIEARERLAELKGNDTAKAAATSSESRAR